MTIKHPQIDYPDNPPKDDIPMKDLIKKREIKDPKVQQKDNTLMENPPGKHGM